MSLLSVKGLYASYGPICVLHGIDLEVDGGGVTTVLGANGAGKTTLLRAICGMVSRKGEISFEGQRIDGMSTPQIARLGIAHVPEGRGTFATLSTEENLRLGAISRKDKDKEVESDFDRVYSYFPRLRERSQQQAGTLSGGEQQMLAIGRALMMRPRLLVMDEPSFGLAPLIVQEIFDIMRKVNTEQQVSVLLVEQNANLALEFSDRACVLETGQVVVTGAPEQLRDNAEISRAYLGV